MVQRDYSKYGQTQIHGLVVLLCLAVPVIFPHGVSGVNSLGLRTRSRILNLSHASLESCEGLHFRSKFNFSTFLILAENILGPNSYTRIYTNKDLDVPAHMFASMKEYMRVRVHLCVYVIMHVCSCVYLYAYAYGYDVCMHLCVVQCLHASMRVTHMYMYIYI